LVLIIGALLALSVALSWTRSLVTPAHAQSAPPASIQVAGAPSVAVDHATVNVSDLAAAQAKSKAATSSAHRIVHRPLVGRPGDVIDYGDQTAIGENVQPRAAISTSPAISSANYPAAGDNGTVIPPDSQGAVGPNHLVVTLNSNVTIQTRTGSVLSSVSLAAFWSSLGGISETFDPRVLFDPYANRWIISSGANSESSSSYILVGVSQTSDPTGGWNLYKVAADLTGQNWADYPTLGFNGDWIVVQANLFTVATNTFRRSNIYAFNKADLYGGGVGQFSAFQDSSGFSDYPAVTYDNNLATEYLVREWSGVLGMLRVSTISGPVGAEVLTTGVAFPKVSSTWQNLTNMTNFAPQLGSTQKIDTDDARIENCVYRNASLWAAQTIYLPGSGAITRTSAQWWQLDTSGKNFGAVQQFGRVDDPTGKYDYAYPTLAVNANNDMLLGYSRFGASQYASANYSFRSHLDALNTLEADTVIKAGEASYFKDYGTGDNRWGDYSNASVDPVNDLDLWTIQEYAGTGNMWGTWWEKVSPPPPPPKPHGHKH
jgi:hypothetical protein